ncbi:MAG: hypothetical protein C5B59_13965 [Bacteroidetes bacterium]|nr:MAG: hypothetical protein C5B59_13965 [Bacteroidota bacterium]
MKKYLFIPFLALATTVGFAQTSNTPYMTKPLSNEAIKEVEAKTQGGNISVTGGNNSDARIEVYITPNGNEGSLSKDEIKKRLDENYEMNISASGGKLKAITKAKERDMNWKRALNVSYRIYVPQSVSTDLSTSGGNIKLLNLSGTQDFRTSGGNLSVDKISGKITGETSGGNIVVSGSKDNIDLETSGGNVEASDCSGKISLKTSGGSLTLKNLNGTVTATTSGGSVKGESVIGELSAHTSGGNVNLQEMSCSIDASTSGGNIDVAVKEPSQFVKLHNSGGNIDLEIPKGKGYDLKLFGDKIKTETLANFSGSMEEKSLTGKLNGGGIPIHVDAGSGRVSLSFR